MEIAHCEVLVFVHVVVKWLHQLLLLKNVILLHSASSSHDFLHSSMSLTKLDDLPKKTSPAPALHSVFEPRSAHARIPVELVGLDIYLYCILYRYASTLVYLYSRNGWEVESICVCTFQMLNCIPLAGDKNWLK